MGSIVFPENYPETAPSVRFETPIRHCNINSYGRVCHSIFDRNYTPTIGIKAIMDLVYGLLLNPDIDDPLDSNLAMMFYNANGEYESRIIAHTKEFAKVSRAEWKKKLSE
jgi:ubiquitin-protein ligase